MFTLFKKILSRIFIGDKWEQDRLMMEAEKVKPFVDRVKKYNGRIVTSHRGSFRVEFSNREDETAYYKDISNTIKSKHGESIDRIFKNKC